MRKIQLENDEIYHIYNRGVEKRDIFIDNQDHYRFIHDLFEFNDTISSSNCGYRFNTSDMGFILVKQRKLLVEILAFCAMPNHFHLLLRQKVAGGITEFMRKLGTGYTNYFNQKNTRVGPLFQGTFKAVLVENHTQLLYLPNYIHLNPLDLIMPEWREKKVKSMKEATHFLSSYRWSSYLDYIGKNNFPSVTQRDFIKSIYGSGTPIDYETEVSGWLQNMSLDAMQDLLLE